MKPIVIHGAGYGIIKKKADGSELLRFDKQTDLRFSLENADQDVWGGDGLVPFESFTTEFRGSITLTNAQFHLNMFNVLAGATVATAQSNSIWIFEEGGTVPTASPYTITVAKSANFVANSDTVRYADTLTPLTRVASAPTVGQYSVSAGVFTFAAGDAGKGVLIDYQYTDTATNHVLLAVDAKVIPVTIIHVGKFLRMDGSYGGLQTEIYAAKYQGAFEINAGRATPSTHAMTFKVLDPGRADKKFMKFTRFELAA